MRSRRTVSLALALLAVAAKPAHAQWFAAGLLGASSTQPATVSVSIPTLGMALQFHDVRFDEKPFKAPPYYAVRVGKWFNQRRLGLDLELTHLKVICRTDESYPTTGTSGYVDMPAGAPMSAVVERYAMTHGLNFVLVNLTAQRPMRGGRAAIYARGGVGAIVPHTETTVLGAAVDRYELAGVGVQGAGGASYRVAGSWSLLGEYRFAFARPSITVGANGTGRMTAATHQVAAGVAWTLGR
jgi:hypothetical protein